MKQIKNLSFKLSHTTQPVEISLDSKNLIITGGNGCGKTSFIKQLHNRLVESTNPQRSYTSLSNEIQSYRESSNEGASNPNYSWLKGRISELENDLNDLENAKITMLDHSEFMQEYADKHFVLSYYQAERVSNISVDDIKPSLQSLKTSESDKAMSEHFGVVFEKYLVAQKVIYNDIVASKDTKAQPQAERIESWLVKVESDLRYLFEDDALKLKFSREKQSFEIHQANKTPFQFNELSSGFSAIMYIYSDLLMKVELKDIPAEQLKGIVLIDEIDAHLHVSLQRKILSFFTHAFPNIQFIVTTHSPFVVQSVNDAVIYDLSKREQLEDLSVYSYQAILEGLLGVTLNSISTEELLDELDDALNIDVFNFKKVKKLTEQLAANEMNLSSEAGLLFQSAKRRLALKNIEVQDAERDKD
ncbi:AAA family ATPase [Vibrio parahaemolyticus]|uniref:AAA family ATPase n=4 Tax=Vibrio parahaemolyticus TaxID=670 RepID=UPI00226B03CA|nr:AAA family ATPase [Vibrio parahaemolyticus]MCX8890664.1 AAA family ATPase [Vibrio parahaemolyticus]